MAHYLWSERAAPTLVIFLLLTGAGLLLPQRATAQDLPVAAYEITGRLVLGEKATPIEGGDVTLFGSDGGKVQSVKSAADGTFKMSNVAAGEYSLAATHDCCLPGRLDQFRVGGLSPAHDVGDIVLATRPPVDSGDAVILSGTVKSLGAAEGVAGVLIHIDSYWSQSAAGDCAASDTGSEECYRPMYENYQFFETMTDPSGAFEIPINRGSAHVRASHEGFDTTAGSVDASQDRSVEIPLRESSDAVVRLYGVLRNDAGETVKEGWVSAGPYYEPVDCPPGYACAQPVEPGKPASAEGDWRFEPTQHQYNSTQAGPDGAWEMFIAAGRLQVSGSAHDHIEAVQIVDAEGRKEIQVSLVLEKMPADSVKVTGVVTDRETGAPIPFAQVSLENQRWGSYAYDETDEQGQFEVMIKPGYTIATFSAYQHYAGCHGDAIDSSGRMYAVPCKSKERDRDYMPFVRSVMAVEGENLQLDATLKSRPPPTSEFSGYVLNETSKEAIVGASVTFYNEETRDWGSATTDKDGSYVIKVHAGYYSIRIWAEGYFDGVQNAEIAKDESQRLDFFLVAGQKRYGYWSHGAYAVAEDGARMAGAPPPMGPQATRTESPPVPSDGQQAYMGAEGGLGPYHPAEDSSKRGGESPSLAPLAAILGLLAVALARRRRAA